MQIGAENKKQVIAMAVLLAIAIPLALYSFKDVLWGSNASAAPSAPAAAPHAKTAGALPAQDNSDPRLRLDILEASRKVKYEAGGRNIFTMAAIPMPTPIASVKKEYTVVVPPTPTPPPPPPPIPIKYYGFASKPSEPKRVFLQQQGAEEVWVAGQGDIVARRYRVIKIAPNSVTMEDVLTGDRQPIPLTVK